MEHFIETVRKYPCLWNSTAIEYRDQELKDAAWAEVMKETDLSSVKEVKLKWKKLRDSYRDALKRQNEMLTKEPSNGANSSKKNYAWKYMAPMQFLQPHMSVRKKPADAPPPAAADAAPAVNGDCSSSSSESSASEPRRPEPRPPRRKRPRAEPLAPDPIDIFFNGMCQSTKRLPYPAQIAIKRTLFDAVLAAEEALVAEQQTLASLWARGAASSSSDDERRPS
ncbi:uncharacterized protein LOC121735223 [Aricia agestis]|uniref:uncharacterized protein LOC121735223 n=1 Tax=Aricia agestis TaxID=91739 RepID=UPI001C20606A|nr:uncharacterized protein LOC121735223 [Aricia agestis]